MIDSHCHLDVAAFDADRGEVLARAAAAGVRGILIPAIRPSTWTALSGLPDRYPDTGVGLGVALGIHPQVVPELSGTERTFIPRLGQAIAQARTPRVIAIGECGLDGATADHEEQERVLRAHVRAARELGLPLVIHVLRAHDVAPRILAEERAAEVGGVMHSFSGPPELVPIYRDLGFAFSFAGPVTWAGARKPIAAARAVPDELLLAETDAPDQAPERGGGVRGGRSEPAFVADVIGGLARARGAEPAAIAALTAANARRVFGGAAGW